jgi:hypothetical protein
MYWHGIEAAFFKAFQLFISCQYRSVHLIVETSVETILGTNQHCVP